MVSKPLCGEVEHGGNALLQTNTKAPLSVQLEKCSRAANFRSLTRQALSEDWRRIEKIVEIAERSANLNGEKEALLKELREMKETLPKLRDGELGAFLKVACRRSSRITTLRRFQVLQQNKRGVKER